MKYIRYRKGIYAAIIIFTWLSACKTRSAKEADSNQKLPAGPTGKILLVSDLHFNPFYDTTLIPQLVKSDYRQWKKIFLGSAVTSSGNYGADTNYPLLSGALGAMHKTLARPDLVIVTGDLLAHEFGSKYTQFTGSSNTDSLHSFIRKTIRFTAAMLAEQFPATPVLPVLGNNDDYCGDYNIQPNGAFLRFYAETWQPLLRGMPGHEQFTGTFNTGGHYAVAMPWDTNHVFIGYNSVFFSASYKNACGTDTIPPGDQEYEWLSKTLKECAAAGKKVWLASHIPPGINVYASVSGAGSCTGNAALMWKPAYNDSLIALMSRYSNTITAGMGGHTHMDDFRLIGGNDSTALSFIHLTPSVSPVFFNNPAFQYVEWQPYRAVLRNNITHYFKGLQTGAATWAPEYNFGTTYSLDSITPSTLQAAWESIGRNPAIQKAYVQYYDVDNASAAPTPWQAYWYGIKYLTTPTYTAHYCENTGK